MIRILYRTADGQLRTNLTRNELPSAFADTKGLLWVDFEGEPPEVCQPLLTEVFGFHPLAVDDALVETHVPKVDDWTTYLYIALHAVHVEPGEKANLSTHELDIFLGEHFLVSHHDEPVLAISRVWDRCQRDERHTQSDADHLAYLVADELASGYMEVFEAMDGMLDIVEDEIFSDPRSTTVERIFVLKRAILDLRRILAPQREVLNRLARDDYAMIDPRDRVYFRDVYDHMVRLYDINESMRDQASGALDTYLSVINNRMNDIMKTLTVITAIFAPITFVTGFYGMNFFAPSGQLHAWTAAWPFMVILGIVALAPLLMWLWIRRRHWV
jgi:magnesium transporter